MYTMPAFLPQAVIVSSEIGGIYVSLLRMEGEENTRGHCEDNKTLNHALLLERLIALIDMLDRVARKHFIEPLLHIREVFLVVLILCEHHTNTSLIRNEREICKAYFVAYKPWSIIAGAAIALAFLLT